MTLTELLEAMIKELRTLEQEVMAYRNIFTMIKRELSPQAPRILALNPAALDEALTTSRRAAALLERAESTRYDAILERLDPRDGQSLTVESFVQWLAGCELPDLN